jgi:cellulase
MQQANRFKREKYLLCSKLCSLYYFTPKLLHSCQKMSFKLVFISVVSSILAGVAQAAPQATTQYPLLPTWKCTSSGCVKQNTSIVIDGGATNYPARGVSVSGNAVTMYQYVNGKSASPRIYLLGADGKYVMMDLLNAELSVDVDYSTLPCGENGAFYLSEMKADGSGGTGSGPGNGYCDAQCPNGYCCNEMDILEANALATAMTPHPCKGNTCDKGGCGYNPYANGQKNFWGPGDTVDTSKVFTVITQFAATGGKLSSITRKYIQNGKEIGGGTITSCGSESTTGGLTGVGQALASGSK